MHAQAALSQGLPRLRPRHIAAAAAAASVAAAGGAWLQRRHILGALPGQRRPRWQLPRPLMEVICGAVGEIVQVAALYPVDTIKVRCQAGGESTASVVRQLLRNGLTGEVLRQLYSGVLSASLCSVLVGSLYYASFCAAKRAANRVADSVGRPQTPPASAPAVAAAAAAVPHHHQPHGPRVDCHHGSVLATICSDEAASTRAAAAAAAAATADATAAPASGGSGGGRLAANLAASLAAGLVGSLVECPLELFKHQAQTGLVSGNLLHHMAAAVQRGGPGALYLSFLPFMVKSLPFDCAELMTYSTLQDARERAAAEPGGRWSALLRAVPDHALDMTIGAAAGAAAVLVSHPADVVKTVMETRGAAAAAAAAPLGAAVAGAAAAAAPAARPLGVLGTGRQVLASHGPRGLLAGMAPRLAEQVPSTMLYWLAVEGCRRVLEPHTAPA